MSEDAWPQETAPDEDVAALFEAAASQPDPAPARADAGMTGEPELLSAGELPAAASARPEATASVPAAASAASAVGDSPELLRWRAEMLLDEMMVGAVDVSAGDVGVDTLLRPVPPRTRAEWIQEEQPAPALHAGANGSTANGSTANSVSHSAGHSTASGSAANGAAYGAPRRAPTPLPAKGAQGSNGLNGSTPPNGSVPPNGAGGFVTATGLRSDGPAAPRPPAAPAAPGLAPPLASVAPPLAPAARPAVAEPPLPPAPFRPPPSVQARTAPAQARPAPISPSAHPFAPSDPLSPEAFAPLDLRAPASPAPAPRAPAPSQEPPHKASKLTAVEDRYPRPAPRAQQAPRPNGSHADLFDADDDLPGLGPVRRNPAVIQGGSITGAMAVGNRNSKYAALLPRSTPWDTHEMEREITALAEEMARVLPPGHESSRRARHLLEKAQTIFASDPLRSAEVDYYLAQVRAIVQRSRQTLQWAGLYRARLMRYWLAWLVLAGVVVAAALIFDAPLAARASARMGWAADGWAANNFTPALVTIFAGALGGALGGLLNLRRYLAHGVGFIDRKYSLRGLILPLMGMLCGALLFALLSGLFWLVGVPLNSAWLLELVPALLAFGLGFAQESIYGTRE